MPGTVIGPLRHVSNPISHIGAESPAASRGDLLCFSHLRWNFVFQRPQHLLTRCARRRRVFFFEEPLFDTHGPRLTVTCDPSGVIVAVPHLPTGLHPEAIATELTALVDGLIAGEHIESYVAWYYTPMALAFSQHLEPGAVVYDCMDELSGFAGAPPGLEAAERALLMAADVVFTGGQSLYESKRGLHGSVHAFPSSVDVAHFARARQQRPDPADQAAIGRPRVGFFGVLDERLDIELVSGASAARPDWHFVFIGPVAKVDPERLPKAANIHYLGPKSYGELPDYIAGWDVAWLPFARNESTRFISPTKTPEYLAAGRPVVSTSIRDVVRPYGELGLARIADTADQTVGAVESALAEPAAVRQPAADAFMAGMSWDSTWDSMWRLVEEVLQRKRRVDARHDEPHGTAPVAQSANALAVTA
jgi:glycosyltransferase involved in cell wall biosynthesis